jgi:phosphoribosylaminoimidazole-succinocarboxamide synthase
MPVMDTSAVFETDVPGLVLRGKVRDICDLGGALLLIATDRISAFDVVMHQPVPGKGRLLTRLSEFWLESLPACTPHHLQYVVDDQHVPDGLAAYLDVLRDRAMLVRKTVVLPIECVVRGYLAGGGWREYQQSGCVSGVRLPAGLRQAERLPQPIFTPSTKATSGHDEPVSFERAGELLADPQTPNAPLRAAIARGLGRAPDAGVTPADALDWARRTMEAARRRSLEIYSQAADHAAQRGIILADTKFEFGLLDGELLLIDEVLTPDSSRFWPAGQHAIGRSPPSFDKQYLRDYLETLSWDKRPPPPAIPAEVIEQTRRRYVEAYQRLTGRAL